MGYYENPPIINLNRGSEKIAAGFANATNSIVDALIKRGDRRREEEKEQKLTIKKLQEEKNKVDLYYNDYISNWSKDQPQGNPIIEQSKALLQQKIQMAADARIALTMETDPTKRKDYLKTISNAESFMDIAGKFGKNAAGEILTYRQTPGIAMNTPGGWAVNADDENLGKTTDTLNVLSGMTQEYENHNVELVDLGGTFAVKISGKKKDGKTFENVVNASDYLNSDGSGTGGFLQKVENVDEFRKQSLNSIIDKETGKIAPSFLDTRIETVKLPSGGGDTYEIVGAQRLNDVGIRDRIRSEASIKAAGYLRGGDTASTRALVNSTLEMGPSYYDKVFKKIENVDLQKAELTRLLEENAFKDFVKDYKTTVENGKIVYWGGEGKVRMVPGETKAAKSSAGKTGSAKTTGTIKNQQAFNKRVENLIKTRKGGISKGGFTLGLLDGRWTLYDKDGVPKVGTENITSPSALATYIGYSPELP